MPPRDKPSARYYEVATILREEIRSGLHPVGEKFLTEQEVCRRFNVSRFTAREALRRLEEAGLVARRQGSGTRVVSRDVDVRYSFTTSTEADVLRYARNTLLEGTSDWKPSTSQQREEVGLDDEQSWLTMEGVRRASGRGPAIGMTTLFVDRRLEAHLPSIDVREGQAIFVQLADRASLRLEGIDQSIYARAMWPKAARLLGVEVGSPALVVVRRFRAVDFGVYEASVTAHAAGRFRYELTLQPSGGGDLI